MPCPSCQGNNRSRGYESGDEITCKYCREHLVLKEQPNRHWEVYVDEE